jgi:hypothetical protein
MVSRTELLDTLQNLLNMVQSIYELKTTLLYLYNQSILEKILLINWCIWGKHFSRLRIIYKFWAIPKYLNVIGYSVHYIILFQSCSTFAYGTKFRAKPDKFNDWAHCITLKNRPTKRCTIAISCQYDYHQTWYLW